MTPSLTCPPVNEPICRRGMKKPRPYNQNVAIPVVSAVLAVKFDNLHPPDLVDLFKVWTLRPPVMVPMSDNIQGRPPEFLPKIITTLRENYRVPDLMRDLIAGLAVAIVALPLSIAIAIASGAAPKAGLVTLIIGGFLISLLGGSRTQIGGPTAAFIVVVFATIHNHGFDGLLTATFLAGIILIIAALFRVGSLVRYVPEPVIRGFTIGIAIVIIASQIKDIFGLTGADIPADFLARVEALWSIRQSFNPAALFIALGTLAIITAFRLAVPKFPGLVVAVVVAACVVVVFDLPVETLHSRFGTLAFSLPIPQLPDLGVAKLTEMLPSALVIAFLAGIESLLSAMVADNMTGSRHRSNTEVLGQGVANAAAALMGGLPATGAIARTATNIRAGGRTPIAGLSHAGFVLTFLLFASPLIGYLALPSLAAVLLLVAWDMSEPHKIRADLSGRRDDAIVLLLTLGLTVLADLTLAITLGVITALLLRTRRHDPPPDWHTPEA